MGMRVLLSGSVYCFSPSISDQEKVLIPQGDRDLSGAATLAIESSGQNSEMTGFLGRLYLLPDHNYILSEREGH